MRTDRLAVIQGVSPDDDVHRNASEGYESLFGFADACATDETWLRDATTGLSGTEVVERASAISGQLAELGVGARTNVGLWMGNRVDYVVLILAITRLGACAVLLPTPTPARLAGEYVDAADIVFAIGDPELLRRLPETGQWSETGTVADSGITYRSALSHSSAEPATPTSTSAACIVFTSGTSGSPKPVVFSHRYILEVGHVIARSKGFVSRERLYLCTPLYHADALVSIVVTALLGGTLSIARRFSVSGFWSEAAQFEATSFYYVGAILALLNKQCSRSSRYDGFRFATGGGAPQVVAQVFEERFRVPVLEAYSQTECMLCCSNTLNDRAPGTVGKPYPGVEIRIVDESDSLRSRGEVGEILVRPPRPFVHFTEYYGDAPSTLEKCRNLFIRTGDLGLIDSSDRLRFHGRIGTSIRCRGENVLPTHIELLAEELPFVKSAAAVGIDSEYGDQDVLLLISLADGSPSEAAAVRECARALPKPMRPRWVKIVGELPMTPTLKLARNQLPSVVPEGSVEV